MKTEFFNEQDQRWALVNQEIILSSEFPKGFQTWGYKTTYLNYKCYQARDIWVDKGHHLGPALEISFANHKHSVLASTLKAKTLFSSSTHPDAILEKIQEGIREFNLWKTKNVFYLWLNIT